MKIRIGIGLGQTHLDADTFAAVVADMAELHFDSLWMSEVLTGAGPDPLIALASAAHLNPQLKLGTTLLLPGRNEIRLAKALASLDVLSRGRLLITFVPGLTIGVERDAIGAPVSERAAQIERTIPRLRRWWSGAAVDGVTVTPRPIQDPLELWLGGLAPASLARSGRLADGWLGAACTPREALAARSAIDHAAANAGRAIDPNTSASALVTRVNHSTMLSSPLLQRVPAAATSTHVASFRSATTPFASSCNRSSMWACRSSSCAHRRCTDRLTSTAGATNSPAWPTRSPICRRELIGFR